MCSRIDRGACSVILLILGFRFCASAKSEGGSVIPTVLLASLLRDLTGSARPDGSVVCRRVIVLFPQVCLIIYLFQFRTLAFMLVTVRRS